MSRRKRKCVAEITSLDKLKVKLTRYLSNGVSLSDSDIREIISLLDLTNITLVAYESQLNKLSELYAKSRFKAEILEKDFMSMRYKLNVLYRQIKKVGLNG